MSQVAATKEERRLVRAAMARLRVGLLAVVLGLVAGSELAFATAWLTLLGGDRVGPRLGLLGIFLPGYTVTWPGVAVGFGYGLAVGALAGALVGLVYNRMVEWRDRRR